MAESRLLSVLHVSDIHNSLENIDALDKWLKNKGEKVDVILLSGDVADMPMEYGFDTSQEAMKFKNSYLDDYRIVVKRLLGICNRVYSIPGNHDVPDLFETDQTINVTDDPFRNLHRKCVVLAPNLYIAGFGGSVPGYQDNQQIWDGFPFRSQEEMTKEVDEFLQPLFAPGSTPFKDPKDRLILMTHCGPNMSDTTIARGDPLHPIYSGSTGLDKWITGSDIQSRSFLNVHGHTHDSFGEVQVGGVSVINSGSLMERRFALYQLSLGADNVTSWKIKSIQKFNL